MKPHPQRVMPFDQVLADPNLLGAGLGGDLSSWSVWVALVKAVFGLKLTTAERETFAVVAGGRQPPTQPVSEFWCVAGRRSGKSRIAAALCVYAARFLPRKLAPGETGEVAVVAASRSQAGVIFKYVVGFLEASPVLRHEIESMTTSEVRLRGNVVIAVHTGSFRTIRGRTLLAGVLDECAYLRDDQSACPDIELYRALLPSLATTGGLLCGISTPYRRSGLLHQKHRDHFGVDDDHVLVAAGRSKLFNPTLSDDVIARAIASDPEAARAEWEGIFRSDISAFLDDETIDRAIEHSRPLELPPQSAIRYTAFCDASGGRHDAYTIAITHKANGLFIADVVRGARAPFDPQRVTAEFAALLKAYHLGEVVSDAYAGEWVTSEFRAHNIKHRRSEQNKSELYLETLPLFMRGAVRLPDHTRLIRELRLLERRTSRAGRDIVDCPRGISEDHANATCGALALLAGRKQPLVISADLLAAAARPTRYSRSHPRSHAMGTRPRVFL